MELSVSDLIGIIGVFIIMIVYTLLQLDKMDAKGFWFSSLNGIGALLIIVSLYYDWNLASFLMESAWLLISLYGVIKYLKVKNEDAAKRGEAV